MRISDWSSDVCSSDLDFGFNGWGGKYEMANDDTVGAAIARVTATPLRVCDWILEAGAIAVDGTGLGVTTEQCLLNPTRNPGLSRGEIEEIGRASCRERVCPYV